jgi:hypothetical protein
MGHRMGTGGIVSKLHQSAYTLDQVDKVPFDVFNARELASAYGQTWTVSLSQVKLRVDPRSTQLTIRWEAILVARILAEYEPIVTHPAQQHPTRDGG